MAAIEGLDQTYYARNGVSRKNKNDESVWSDNFSHKRTRYGGCERFASNVNRRSGTYINQFSNKSNYLAHYDTTGPEIWNQTNGKLLILYQQWAQLGQSGVSRYLKEKDNNIQIIGVQPTEGSRIPGIRRWQPETEIFNDAIVDQIIDISQSDAEKSMSDFQKIMDFLLVSLLEQIFIFLKL